MAAKFFETKVFDNWRKSREAEGKTQAAIVGRLDNVTRAIGGLAKIMNRRPF
jgi:hypothetical protein